MNKEDKRVIATEQKIKDAYIALILEHNYDSYAVTVAELCRRSGIHRTTFYKHYDSMKQVYNELSKDIIEEFCDSISNLRGQDHRNYLQSIIELYRKYHVTDSISIQMSGFQDNQIAVLLNAFAQDMFEKKYSLVDNDNCKDLDADLVYRMITGGFAYTILTKLYENPQLDAAELARQMLDIGNAIYRGVLTYKES